MLSRDACERRVYRLAVVLTGNPDAATAVIESVVHAQPDLRKLDSPHLDRLTVLRSREFRPVRLADPRLDTGVAGALAALSEQQREAWVFRYVYRMAPRSIARAMDCSVRAVRHHLISAEGAMEKAVGNQTAAGKALLKYTMQLDVPAFYHARMSRRRRWRGFARVLFWLALLALAAAAVVWLWRSEVLDRLVGN